MTKQYRLVKECRADGINLFSVEEKTVLSSGTVFWGYVSSTMSRDEALTQAMYNNLLAGAITGKIVLHGEPDA